MVTTDDAELAGALRRFRNHGIDTDHRERDASGRLVLRWSSSASTTA